MILQSPSPQLFKELIYQKKEKEKVQKAYIRVPQPPKKSNFTYCRMRVLSLFALFQVCQGFLTAPQGLNKVNLNVGGALSRAVPVKAPLEIGRSLTTSLPPLMSSAVAGEDRVARHGRTLSSLRNFVARLRCHLDFTLKIVVLFRETFSPPLLQFRK